MGNSAGKKSLPNLQRRFTSKSSHSHLKDSEGFVRYNDKELTLLDRMFQDLAKRSPDETMSKETFLQYFALPGILGERLFAVFDAKKNGVIDFEEFVNGLARYNRGSLQEKIAMLFEMYDMDGQSQVKPEELSLILYSVITPTTALFYSNNNTDDHGHDITNVSKLSRQTVEKMVNDAFEHCDTNKDGLLSQDQFTTWVKQNPGALQLLETVFAKHIWSGWDSRMDPSQLQQHSLRSTGSNNSDDSEIDLMEHKQSPQPATESSPPRIRTARYSKEVRNSSYLSLTQLATPSQLSALRSVAQPTGAEALYDKLTQIYLDEGDEHVVCICAACEYKYYTSIHIEEPLNETNDHYAQFVFFNKKTSSQLEMKYCPSCGSKLAVESTSSVAEIMNLGTAATLLPSTSTATLNEVGRKGILYKIGAHFKSFVSRYYVIREKFLYTFKKEHDAFPINVVFIAGWYMSEINDSHSDRGYYGIQMTAPSVQQSKILYSKSRRDRDEWLRCLQVAAATQSIKQHYSIGRILGKGHFSLVHLGVHRESGKECAVKIVQKSSIDAREKMSLRNEIVMMRLVNHPCIIRMLDVFEDQQRIYMVMTLAPYGDFFARWKKRKIFDEDTARVIIWKLLDATQYLHALGIVHRDLKPENILFTTDNVLKIADFGSAHRFELKPDTPRTPLSPKTMDFPDFEMKTNTGTPLYVAPEILSKGKYSHMVDYWSLGVMLYTMLCGYPPFSNRKSLHKMYGNIIDGKYEFGALWDGIDEDAMDLVRKLLTVDAKHRIDGEQILAHKWMVKHRGKKKK
eukprot:608372_1